MILNITDLYYDNLTVGREQNEENRLFFDSSYLQFLVGITDSKPCLGIVVF